jgi:hypothetical protein
VRGGSSKEESLLESYLENKVNNGVDEMSNDGVSSTYSNLQPHPVNQLINEYGVMKKSGINKKEASIHKFKV